MKMNLEERRGNFYDVYEIILNGIIIRIDQRRRKEDILARQIFEVPWVK